MLNKHNLKIKGIKKASSETVNWTNGGYTEVFYNKNTGEVWCVDQISLGHNSWTEYHDPDVVKITETERHLTMQEISDMIFQELNWRN